MTVPLHTVEIVESANNTTIARFRVSGGWMYYIATISPENYPAVAMSMVPDPPVVEVHRG
jgi:hypothetical protein